jgi:protein involved in polysaccharide export with SLBB domain
MKKFLIPVYLIASIAISSQELDEAYLESLPDSVRDDVLQTIDQREKIDKPVYRRQSSMIDKESVSSDRFGDKIFDMMQSSFMPINEPNIDSSYTLDFGDTLEIQLIGQKNFIEELSIKRDGSINIPEMGKIFVSGLSLGEANKLIKSKVASVYIGTEAFITLVNIRDIQVIVTGNAFNPGIYTLNGNSNVLHALSMAGGVDENGSYRQIDLIRNNKVINTIDLYEIFIYGNSSFGPRVRSGDTILVRSFLKVVSISGAVKRPGIYELKENNNFSDLLKYANGFSDNADMDTLRLERPYKNEINLIEIDSLDQLKSFTPKSADSLFIRAYERRTVEILGAVFSPGKYLLSKDETLYSLINKANGYTKNAYPFGGVLVNEKALELNEIAAEKLYRSYIQKLITKGDALFASESLPFILNELKEAQISGRVIAEFDLNVIQADRNLDTTLNDGDQILIPIKTEQVYIFGEVNQPGATRYKPNQSLSQYISNSGGLLESSDIDNIFVVYPNGEVQRSKKGSKVFALNSRSNDILIYPGTVIYVPRNVQQRELSLIASIWAPIISSAATSITALTVLNNQ